MVTSSLDIKAEAEKPFWEFLQHKPANFTGIEVSELQNLLHYRCSDMEKENLIKDVTAQEVRKVLFAVPNEK